MIVGGQRAAVFVLEFIFHGIVVLYKNNKIEILKKMPGCVAFLIIFDGIVNLFMWICFWVRIANSCFGGFKFTLSGFIN